MRRFGEAFALPTRPQIQYLVGIVHTGEQGVTDRIALAVGRNGLAEGAHGLAKLKNCLIAQAQVQAAEGPMIRHKAADQ